MSNSNINILASFIAGASAEWCTWDINIFPIRKSIWFHSKIMQNVLNYYKNILSYLCNPSMVYTKHANNIKINQRFNQNRNKFCNNNTIYQQINHYSLGYKASKLKNATSKTKMIYVYTNNNINPSGEEALPRDSLKNISFLFDCKYSSIEVDSKCLYSEEAIIGSVYEEVSMRNESEIGTGQNETSNKSVRILLIEPDQQSTACENRHVPYNAKPKAAIRNRTDADVMRQSECAKT